MQPARRAGRGAGTEATLVRSSFVPLYYQLQETLKEQIESGVWAPGDMIPSEPELARRYSVSRAVVRQALAILEDDHQLVRVRGRGTFVSEPKVSLQAGGLTRLLASPRDNNMSILVLDKSHPTVEQSIQSHLGVGKSQEVTRITTLLSMLGKPVAITYSFFRDTESEWLCQEARVGRNLAPDLTLGDYGLKLSSSHITMETSHCGQFEADRFGIAHRSGVFLVHTTEYVSDSEGERPFEFARAEYRGDLVQFRISSAANGG